MPISLPSQIGSVKIQNLAKTSEDDYADPAEDLLLRLFSEHKDEKVESSRSDILAGDPSWPIFYHLTPERASLLSWYEFTQGANVLEIGSGCGAITEALVKKDIVVTGLELTPKRTLINAHRNHSATNLNLVVGNLQNYNPKQKFDYIVCIGVLEYAGTFIKSASPYTEFLRLAKKLLAPNGIMLIAIENRFGLKYWAGAKEDHTQQYFDGLNAYPGTKRVQTFGKKELELILSASDFKVNQFFYPYPDYKTPFFVYSDSYFPGNGTVFPLGRLPTPTLDRPREHFFSEQLLMPYIEVNGLFQEFSNSFLVEASS